MYSVQKNEVHDLHKGTSAMRLSSLKFVLLAPARILATIKNLKVTPLKYSIVHNVSHWFATIRPAKKVVGHNKELHGQPLLHVYTNLVILRTS